MSYGKLVRSVGIVTTIPMVLIAGPLAGFWIGSWIDVRFGIDPWGKSILLLLGFVASLKQVIEIIKRWIKDTEKE